MKPFVKEYVNEDQLHNDVGILKNKGVDKDDIYILTHDNQSTRRLVHDMHTNKIGIEETGIGDAIANIFSSKGDELRNKMEDLGLSEVEANFYEEKLDDGKVLLFVTNHVEVNNYLI